MDYKTEQTKRQAFITIGISAAIFILVFVGLIMMGVESVDVVSQKALRSEVAQKVDNRETMDCTAEWVPEDAYEFVDAGQIANPKRMSMTFAMQDNGDKFYLDRYFDGEKYLSFYAEGGEYYVWSAMRHLWEEGQLRSSELRLKSAPNIKMNSGEFEKEYPDFFGTVDEMIKDLPAGTELKCDIGGTSGYNKPDTRWYSLKEVEDIEKQRGENE